MQLDNVVSLSSFAGVGLRENVVANGLEVSVNGQLDLNKNDFQARINWGDGSSSAGALVNTGSDSEKAFYTIKGSHIYNQTGRGIRVTVTVTGPEGTSTSALTAYANVAPMPSGIGGTPPATFQAAAPTNVWLQLDNVVSINSYAGVGFQENVVADGLEISVNGQPGQNKDDIHAQINWGDSAAWTSADLVYTGSDAEKAFYQIKGSHIYNQPGRDIPIVVFVTGPDGTSTSALTAYANVAPMPSGIPGTPPAAAQATAPSNVWLQLDNVVSINSYAGVGFQENVVADGLEISVNNQPDPNKGDIHAQINWGDSAGWTAGDLIYTGSDGQKSFYLIKGSHIYNQPGSDIPIVVYVSGPDGTSTSALTAYANVAPNPNPTPAVPLLKGDTSITDVPTKGMDNTPVATFQDPQQPTGLKAIIDYGDGSKPTDGTIVPDGGGTYVVESGPHEFPHSGPFTITVRLDDLQGDQSTVTDPVNVVSPLTLGNLTPTQWKLNQPGYDGTITISGGSGVYQNAQVTGLPGGLTESQSGSTIIISGTPTQSGTFALQVSVQDGSGTMATGTDTLTIDAPALALGSLTPNQWTLNQPGYDGTIAISGGSGAYQNAQVTGLPAGLHATLSGNTITVSGTPTQAGTFSLQVSIQDSSGDTGSSSDSLTINPAIALGNLCPTQWDMNQAGYPGAIAVNGGTGGYRDLRVSGLPKGLTATLAGNTVSFHGTPTQTGTFNNIVVSLYDATGASGSRSYTLTIRPAVTLGPLSLTEWDVNKAGFVGTIAVSGGSGSYSNLQVVGKLPPGLNATLAGSTITIRGTPTLAGTFVTSLTVQDNTGPTDPIYEIKIDPPPSLGSLYHAQWYINQPDYYAAIAVTGGTGNYSNLQVTGLARGLTAKLVATAVGSQTDLNGKSTTHYQYQVEITGKPTQYGTFIVDMSLQDSFKVLSTNASYTLNILVTPLNQRMDTFLSAQNDHRLGGGECSDAATEALRVCGGSFMIVDPGQNGNYAWGTRFATIAGGKLLAEGANPDGVEPGDIIQCWSPDGHHTMIVASVDKDGFPKLVHEQNWGEPGNRYLRIGDRNSWLKSYAGTITIYHPVERTRPPTGKSEFTIANTTSEEVLVEWKSSTSPNLRVLADLAK
jgi:hypothetical protein